MGIFCKDKGEWDKALEFYERSLKIDQELGDKQGISNSYNNLGILYKDKGEWDKALECYEKSLEMNEELGDEQGISSSYGNLGILYKDKGEWDKALECYEKSLEMFQKLAVGKEFQALTIIWEIYVGIKGNGIRHWSFTKKV